MVEHAGAEAERHRQPGRRQPHRIAAVSPRLIQIGLHRPSRLGPGHPRTRFRPIPQQAHKIGLFFGDEIEGGDIGVILQAGQNTALMRSPERLDLLTPGPLAGRVDALCLIFGRRIAGRHRAAGPDRRDQTSRGAQKPSAR